MYQLGSLQQRQTKEKKKKNNYFGAEVNIKLREKKKEFDWKIIPTQHSIPHPRKYLKKKVDDFQLKSSSYPH